MPKHLVIIATISCALLSLQLVVAALPPAWQQATSSNQPRLSEDQIHATMRDAGGKYSDGDYSGARELYHKVIASSPDNLDAHSMAGNCSMRMRDFKGAISEYKEVIRLQPDNLNASDRLLKLYGVEGMRKEGDAERSHHRKVVLQLKTEGRLPPEYSFESDSFMVGEKAVIVMEYFPDLGEGNRQTRYVIQVLSVGGKQRILRLDSTDDDQSGHAAADASRPKAPARIFVLSEYTSNVQNLPSGAGIVFIPQRTTVLRRYAGEPSYDKFRTDLETLVRDSSKAQ